MGDLARKERDRKDRRRKENVANGVGKAIKNRLNDTQNHQIANEKIKHRARIEPKTKRA